MTTWTYPATVVRVVDADTIRLSLDLGLHIWRTDNCRILGINAPELNTIEGKDALRYAAELLPIDTEVTFVSKRLDKYGRPLGTVTRNGVDFGQLMLDAGHAVVMKP
jgi:endonuclease YncB( thermonuclease family)